MKAMLWLADRLKDGLEERERMGYVLTGRVWDGYGKEIGLKPHIQISDGLWEVSDYGLIFSAAHTSRSDSLRTAWANYIDMLEKYLGRW